MIKIITEEMVEGLRTRVRSEMSEKRYTHTLGVEREIARLAELFCPDSALMLRAAALLHDITKEYSDEDQLSILSEHGYDVEYYKKQSSKIYHSLTASLIIPKRYSEFSVSELVNAVRVHTTGAENMSLYDKLLYLADYIEDTRTFEDCITLRRFFWKGIDSHADKRVHLDKTILLSLDMTIKDLISQNKVIASDTVKARNSLLHDLKNKELI